MTPDTGAINYWLEQYLTLFLSGCISKDIYDYYVWQLMGGDVAGATFAMMLEL